MSQIELEYECPMCYYKVDSINDLQRCGHCDKWSCPNCNNIVYSKDLPK